MPSNDWFSSEADDGEDFSSSLHQRTEELYQIPSCEIDDDGLIECPVILLRDMVVFPHMISPIYITPGENLIAIQDAQYNYQTVIALVLKDPSIESPTPDDFLPIGVEIAVGRLLNIPDGNSSALVQGRKRVQVHEITQYDPYFKVKAVPLFEDVEVDRHLEALMRATRDQFKSCVQLDRSMPEEAYLFSMNISDPGWLADMVATAISLPFKDRQDILLEISPKKRLEKVNIFLAKELDVLQIESKIQSQIQNEVDKSHREYYLREQLKAIQNELGETDVWLKDIVEIKEKIEQVNLPEEVKLRALKEAERLSQTPSMAPEMGMIRTYLEWILDLPWNEQTEDNLDVLHARKVLDENHYGLKQVKDRILEFIAVKSLKPKKSRQPILCFVGPPGTGKTSIGKSIAESLERKFVRLSLGGVRDEAEIRGHRRTYIGALPGRILQTMRRAETINPLFMLDEIDKMSSDFRGDPASALLEVLDPEQNYAFSDHYIELPYDLSNVLFITTANTLATIPSALLDRMEVIEFSSYLEEEKVEIAKKFLVPRQLEECGLEPGEVTLYEDTLRRIIRDYTYEAGVRNLEREIGRLFRKIARLKSEKRSYPNRILSSSLEKYLGPKIFFQMEGEKEDEVGVATALAWTESGGEIMPVEVLLYEGKGNLQMTGQIGDIMQESAQAALSYIKSCSEEFGIDSDIYERIDIHLHVPEGAIPKDGPSAGITMAIALLSALTDRKIYKDIGMTGEITLRGKVLQVGGVKEKILAAKRAGLSRVLIPEKNDKDLFDVPKKILNGIEIIPVSHIDQVIELALFPPSPEEEIEEEGDTANEDE